MAKACKTENNNVTWFNGYVTRKDREKLHGHRGAAVWFTGLSASGKSTIAHRVEKEPHYREDRRRVRSLFSAGEFIEIYIDCPVEVCAGRDEKGIYERAQAGVIENFTGISAPYEIPESPELVIQSHQETPEQAAFRVLGLLENFDIIKSN